MERFYISIPFIGSLLTILIYLIFTLPLEVPQIIERGFLCVFIFSIGYQTVPFLKKKFIHRSIGLVFLTIFLITLMELLSKFLSDPYQSLFGSIFFAYNRDLLRTVVDSQTVPYIEFWGSLNMILVYLMTPLFLSITEKTIKPDSSFHLFIKKETFPFSFKWTGVTVLTLWLLTLGLIWLSTLFEDHILFLYDFVFALVAGGLMRKAEEKYQKKSKKRTHIIHQIGTLHLYLFIIVTITGQFHFLMDQYDTYFNVNIFFFILIKVVIIGGISIYSMKKCHSKWEGSELMVGAIAGWTFSLNAPVVCMHGMRTAMNKWGPAPYILFIIPPIILWIVNYIHLWLLAILQI